MTIDIIDMYNGEVYKKILTDCFHAGGETKHN